MAAEVNLNIMEVSDAGLLLHVVNSSNDEFTEYHTFVKRHYSDGSFDVFEVDTKLELAPGEIMRFDIPRNGCEHFSFSVPAEQLGGIYEKDTTQSADIINFPENPRDQ